MKDLGKYQKAMDELMIAGKVMDSTLNANNYDEASDTGVSFSVKN